MIDPKTLTTNREWDKIVSVLIRSHLDQSKLNFWQTKATGERLNYTGHISMIDKKLKIFTIDIAVQEDLTLYVLYNELQILFKAIVQSVDASKSCSIIEIPDQMGIPKDIQNFHYYFLEGDKKKIKIHTHNPNTKRPYEKTFSLVELHNLGAQFIVDHEDFSVFPEGSSLQVKFITDQRIATNIEGSVINSARYKKNFIITIEFLQDIKKIIYVDENASVNLKETKIENKTGPSSSHFEETGIFQQVKIRDPKMAAQLLDNVNYLDNTIRYMSTKTKAIFLKEIDLVKFGHCLRLTPPELVDYFLKDTTEAIKEEINHHMRATLKASEIAAYQKEIIDFLRDKQASGLYVLEKSKDVLI